MNTYCPHCGTHVGPFADGSGERACKGCNQITYRNPLSVAIALVPVGEGLLVVRRGKKGDPGYGELALPGGFVNWGEVWQETIVREVKEETGLYIPSTVETFTVISSPRNILIFGLAQALLTPDHLNGFEANEEVSEIAWITPEFFASGRQLAFPAHSEVAERYFQCQKG